MKKENICRRVVAMGLSAFIFLSGGVAYSDIPVQAVVNTSIEKDYIVMAKEESQVNDIESEYDISDVVNDNGEDYLKENYMTTLTLTNQEVQELSDKKNVEFIEEDDIVKASETITYDVISSEKKIEEAVQGNQDEEWNLRMIHADKARKRIRKKKNHVKIAILDSGVDYNTDMNIAETISLVPGEEEINPLFMDASGHGTSVAGVAAAKDNKNRVTGVDPYAEIYSIRVLDDDNCSPVSRVIEGIYMAIDKKVNIINMSFGVSTYSQALEKAVKDASDAGILVIAAAGNTGSAEEAGVESTVQYPAAFDEVLAVGSVDKRGNVADSSATGSEIELVAPGELVRSAGMFGSELVASGTSLAAPQVAGAAALILEKDKKVSPEFVRELLNKSANSYGEDDEYGFGLVDVNYALENYDSFKKQYKRNSGEAELEDNESKVMVFEDTGCVEGCWALDSYKKNHESLIPSNFTNVKRGARFPDNKSYIEDKKNDLYYFQGMEHNPWWHGYYRKVYKNSGEYLNNYVSSYIYETRLANAVYNGTTATLPRGMSNQVATEIRNDIKVLESNNKKILKVQLGNNVTREKERDFLWGMAIHNLSDSFAHSSAHLAGDRIKHRKDSTGKDIQADCPMYCPERWACAEKAVNEAIKKYKSSYYQSGTYSEFSSVCSQSSFKMININLYIKENAGQIVANKYDAYSVMFNKDEKH